VAEAAHEGLHVLVNERVLRDLGIPLLELRSVGKLAVDQQIGHLQIRGLFGELLDGVASIPQDAVIAVYESDRRAARGRVDERGIVTHQTKVVVAHSYLT